MNRSDALKQLGLDAHAPMDDIQSAFRQMAKQVHPDLNGGTDILLRRLILARDLLMSRPNMVGLNRPCEPTLEAVDDLPAALTLTPPQAIHGGECEVCHDGKRLRITLPKGLRAGEKLRLTTEDDVLIFNIDIAEGDGQRVVGNDVWTSAEIARDVLYYGGKDTIETPHGPVDVQVVRAFERGSCLCLKGYGLPATATFPAGDLYVRLEARLPAPRPAAELRQAFARRWA